MFPFPAQIFSDDGEENREKSDSKVTFIKYSVCSLCDEGVEKSDSKVTLSNTLSAHSVMMARKVILMLVQGHSAFAEKVVDKS